MFIWNHVTLLDGDGGHTSRRWPVGAPGEQGLDPPLVTLGFELDRAIVSVLHPTGEPVPARLVDGRRAKRDPLYATGNNRSYTTHREENVAWPAALCVLRLSNDAAIGGGDQLIA